MKILIYYLNLWIWKQHHLQRYWCCKKKKQFAYFLAGVQLLAFVGVPLRNRIYGCKLDGLEANILFLDEYITAGNSGY